MKKILNFIRGIFHDFWGTLRNITLYISSEEQRLVVQSIIIGVVVWGVIYPLKLIVHDLSHLTIHWLENAPTLLFVFIPLCLGAVIVAAITRYKAATIHYHDDNGHIHELNDAEGDGLERTIALYYSSEPTIEHTLTGQEGVGVRWELPTFSLATRKFAATVVTLGSGGSGGLEASVTLIGESLSAGLFKPRRIGEQAADRINILHRIWNWWRPDNPDDLQTAQLSGVAAAVSVLLGAPFAAAFFATEVMYHRRPIIEKLIYALISALVAFFLTNMVESGHTPLFTTELHYLPPTTPEYMGVLILMSAVISLVAIFFSRLRARMDHAFHHNVSNTYVRMVLGAALTGTVAITVAWITAYFGLAENGLELVLGTGGSAIDAAFAGELTVVVAFVALFAKMFATLFTVSSGGSAGLLIPSLFFGTMVASMFATWFGYQPMMLIGPAMAASLIAIVNVPLAAILFTVELFGSAYMVPALIVLVVSSILAHDNSIYRTQRETFDARQILPGISVRRVRMPLAWANQTLVDLDFRKKFDLNVIGLLEYRGEDGHPHIRLATASTTLLEEGDVLVVLGTDEKLDGLETAVANLRAEELEEIIEGEQED
ncbi:MAG: chloride channel protein [Anaerolineae bacterium]|nr:chloride channel protein [Anaerolineae bacterium]